MASWLTEPGWGCVQVLAYNECLMRSKYAYDFAILFDVDEFIYMNTTALGVKGPMPLPKFLRQTFPPKVLTLSIAWGYFLWRVWLSP